MNLAYKELSSYAKDIFSIDMRIQALKYIVNTPTAKARWLPIL